MNEETHLFTTPSGQQQRSNEHPAHPHANTKRLLTSLHTSMISLGGIIGTGLFIGVRITLLNGPIISLMSYLYISLICFYIIQAVGKCRVICH